MSGKFRSGSPPQYLRGLLDRAGPLCPVPEMLTMLQILNALLRSCLRTRRETDIEWADATWNPVTGCTKVSPGCKFCYAESMAKRLQAMGQANYRNGFELTLQPHMLPIPLKRRRPTLYFVNSMSDLYHEGVPDDYVRQVFEVMRQAHWHDFQVLTKRAERLAEVDAVVGEWPENVWQGVSVENSSYRHRIDLLRETRAKIKFLSLEPLIGSLAGLDLSGIDWVIVGGESGPRARPMHPDWARDLRDQCRAANVPFHFKQWGAYGPDGVRRPKKENGRELDGRTWDEWPREFEYRRVIEALIVEGETDA